MASGWIDRWKGLRNRLAGQGPGATSMRRLSLAADPAAIYAIGDVHGCLDLLLGLEAAILADAETVKGERWIVILGDMIDRGGESAQVLAHLREPAPQGFKRVCLMGNHEAMMLDFLRRPTPNSPWLEYGGRETLASYGVPVEALIYGRFSAKEVLKLIEAHVPRDHIEFLAQLPVMLETPTAVMVHAGLRPGRLVADQIDSDLLGYRDNFHATYEEFGRTVVHGHTIRDTALIAPHRIAIDTGAYFSGRLTAVRISPDKPPALLSSARPVRNASSWP